MSTIVAVYLDVAVAVSLVLAVLTHGERGTAGVASSERSREFSPAGVLPSLQATGRGSFVCSVPTTAVGP